MVAFQVAEEVQAYSGTYNGLGLEFDAPGFQLCACRLEIIDAKRNMPNAGIPNPRTQSSILRGDKLQNHRIRSFDVNSSSSVQQRGKIQVLDIPSGQPLGILGGDGNMFHAFDQRSPSFGILFSTEFTHIL